MIIIIKVAVFAPSWVSEWSNGKVQYVITLIAHINQLTQDQLKIVH